MEWVRSEEWVKGQTSLPSCEARKITWINAKMSRQCYYLAISSDKLFAKGSIASFQCGDSQNAGLFNYVWKNEIKLGAQNYVTKLDAKAVKAARPCWSLTPTRRSSQRAFILHSHIVTCTTYKQVLRSTLKACLSLQSANLCERQRRWEEAVKRHWCSRARIKKWEVGKQKRNDLRKVESACATICYMPITVPAIE